MQGLRGIIGMKSSLFRRSPTSSPITQKHDLSYKLYMPHLFLDEVNEVFKGRGLWSVDCSNLSFSKKRLSRFKNPPRGRVRETISEQTGAGQRPGFGTHSPPDFRSLLQSRDFYYAWDQKDPTQCPSGEITNTPWGERYAKAFRWADSDTNGSTKSKHRFEKEFHALSSG